MFNYIILIVSISLFSCADITYDLNSNDKTLVLTYWEESKCVEEEIFSEYYVSMDSIDCISEGNTWHPEYISRLTYLKEE